MVVVTGTKRSGTSLWMQILTAGGLPALGEAFPASWGESIREANPRGFYESAFRKGIYYATNPDPKTGTFVPPKETRRHVVKVFIPGLIRSDLAYLDRVIATMRHWREYGGSLGRLYRIEDAWLTRKKAETTPDDPRWRTFRGELPAAVEWWFDNYELIRDAATRRYPIHLVSYDHVLRDPEAVIDRVTPWLGGLDRAAALAAIDPSLRTQRGAEGPVDGVEAEEAAVFDELFALVDAGKPLPPAFVAQLNATQHRLEERYRPVAARDRDDPRDEGEAASPVAPSPGAVAPSPGAR